MFSDSGLTVRRLPAGHEIDGVAGIHFHSAGFVKVDLVSADDKVALGTPVEIRTATAMYLGVVAAKTRSHMVIEVEHSLTEKDVPLGCLHGAISRAAQAGGLGS